MIKNNCYPVKTFHYQACYLLSCRRRQDHPTLVPVNIYRIDINAKDNKKIEKLNHNHFSVFSNYQWYNT